VFDTLLKTVACFSRPAELHFKLAEVSPESSRRSACTIKLATGKHIGGIVKICASKLSGVAKPERSGGLGVALRTSVAYCGFVQRQQGGARRRRAGAGWIVGVRAIALMLYKCYPLRWRRGLALHLLSERGA
jgi:hypothetical protein